MHGEVVMRDWIPGRNIFRCAKLRRFHENVSLNVIFLNILWKYTSGNSFWEFSKALNLKSVRTFCPHVLGVCKYAN